MSGGNFAVLLPASLGNNYEGSGYWDIVDQAHKCADMWEQVTTTDVIMSHLKDLKLSTQLKYPF